MRAPSENPRAGSGAVQLLRGSVPAIVLAALLTACAGSGPNGSPPSVPVSDGAGGAPSGSASGGAAAGTDREDDVRDLAVFASPSGVVCDIGAGGTSDQAVDSVECFVPRPAYDGWEMTDQGPRDVTCGAGLKLELVTNSEYWLSCEDSTTLVGPTLPEGTVTSAGGFTCRVGADIIECSYDGYGMDFRVGNELFDIHVD